MSKFRSNLPVLITPGDIAGVGPEVALKALADRDYGCKFTLVGPEWIWNHAAEKFSVPINSDFLNVPSLSNIPKQKINYGEVSETFGFIAMECVRTAAEECIRKNAAAIVTAPLTKSGIHIAGYKYQGHTDFLAEISKTPKHAMMLSTGNLRVLLVTHHQSIVSVSKSLTIEKITEKIVLAHQCGIKLNIDNPKIAVCALNPHAGENNAFGDEEGTIISPSIKISQNKNINASGPYPSDTLFYRAANGEFDFVIAMYHDQGLIPVKLIGFENGVNTTLGLPFVRTSPDHGSAYDIAGKGIANPSSMISAIEMAIKLFGGCAPE